MKEEYDGKFVDGLIRQSRPSLFMLHRISNIIAALNPLKNERILEIGCGIGTVSNEISKYGCKVTGIDFSEVMVLTATKIFGRIASFWLGDAKDLSDYRNYDAVVAADVMEHLTDEEFEQVIVECHSALNENGRLVIYSPCRDHFIEIMKRNNFILRENKTHVGMRSAGMYSDVLSKYFCSFNIRYSTSHIPVFNLLEKALIVFLPLFRRRLTIVAEGKK